MPEIARALGRSPATVSQTLREVAVQADNAEPLRVAIEQIRGGLADGAAVAGSMPALRPSVVHVLSGLRDARVAAGLTQQELAERVGVARETVARVEHGGRPARRETARRLARTLGMAMSELTEAPRARLPGAGGSS